MPGCCIAADRDTAPILPTSTSYWSASFRHLPDQPIDYVVLVRPGECVRPDHQVLSGLRLFEYVFRSVPVLTHVVVALLQLIAQPLPKRLVQLIAKLKLLGAAPSVKRTAPAVSLKTRLTRGGVRGSLPAIQQTKR